MKPKVYKAKLNFSETLRFLEVQGYESIGQTKRISEHEVKIALYFDVHPKDIPKWVEELLQFFNLDNYYGIETPNQYNAILVVKTQKSVYLLPSGRAYWVVEKYQI